MKIYLVFYAMYFKPANNNIPFKRNPPKIDPENQKIEYKIEVILDQ